EYGAYERTFKRLGLEAISVESDTGAMGGDVAHEFQVLTEVGEDRIAICSNCDYRANMEKATRYMQDQRARADGAPPRSQIATSSSAATSRASESTLQTCVRATSARNAKRESSRSNAASRWETSSPTARITRTR